MLRIATGLLLDVGLPVATYYVLHLVGVSDTAALLAAAVAAVLRIVVVAVRHHRLNQFALVMLLVYGIGVVLALVSGDARTLLLRNSLITASIGVIFLVGGIRGRRPLTLTALQSFWPARADHMARQYNGVPEVRHGFRLASVVWGIGLIAEAAVRIPLVYLLPIEIAVAATEGLLLLTIALLGAWTAWYLRRNREFFALR